MVEVQERVARLEGRVEGHARMLTDVGGAVRHFETRMGNFEARVDQRFTALEQKLDTHFRWLVGIQFTTLVTLVAALLAVAG